MFLGAGFGAVARYWMGLALNRSFPWGTLTVNVLGGLLIGVLVGVIGSHSAPTRLFVIVGILGGFTTFSSFSWECIELINAHRYAEALGYVLLSNIGALGACGLGYWTWHHLAS